MKEYTFVDGDSGSIGAKLSECGRRLVLTTDDGADEIELHLDFDHADHLCELIATLKDLMK